MFRAMSDALQSVLKELGSLCREGMVKDAMELWATIEFQLGFRADSVTYTSLVQACARSKSLIHGKLIHGRMIRNSFEPCLFLQNNLLNMYCKCGCFGHAHQLFVQISKPNLISWNALISGYSQLGLHIEALEAFQRAMMSGVLPDRFTLCSALSACGQAMGFSSGKQIHGRIVAGGFGVEAFVNNSLIDMYVKFGQMDEAQGVLHSSPELDEASYNTLIAGYARTGQNDQTWSTVVQMLSTGFRMNSYTAGSCLKACADSNNGASAGKQIHASMIKSGLEYDVVVASATLDMYAKNGCINDAHKVFSGMPYRNVVSYNVMIAGTIKNLSNGSAKTAAKLFLEMLRNGMKPSSVTFSAVLKAFTLLQAFNEGKQIHAHIIKARFFLDEFISSALIDMYTKSGEIGEGLKCFSLTGKQDIICWTAAIAGSVWNRQYEGALRLFHEMLGSELKPDEYTISIVLSACASLAVASTGSQIHAYAKKSGRYCLIGTANALICMYAKSGEVEKAEQLFEENMHRDVITWSALISAHAHQGSPIYAFRVLDQMKESGIVPNEITFLSVLTACSHAGLVHEGFIYYNSMIRDHNIHPNIKHCACIVDLLGRAGKLIEAEQFIFKSEYKNDPIVWRALLGACRNHRDILVGKRAAERIIELEPQSSAAYVLLYNMYISSRKMTQARDIRELMMLRGVKKEPGVSWINTGKQTHCFVSCDTSHPQIELIFGKLESLLKRIMELGYVDNQEVLFMHDDGDQYESSLYYHSEKLAVAFGLLSLPGNFPVRVMKNVRVCGDCHSFMKYVSKSEDREIVLRDCTRFHHFRGGLCSCGDYW